MKKTAYIQPQTKVVLVETNKMIASSSGVNSSGNVVIPANLTGGDGSDAASRHSNSLWDDEDW
ncbi:MAG: hypothetical protein J5552_11605 [Prevotella sp.]|nr:hypothetical protein [Prevotella sp.]